MKHISRSMDPEEAAEAFFGQDDEAFGAMLDDLTAHDPRLAAVFLQTRKRFLETQKS